MLSREGTNPVKYWRKFKQERCVSNRQPAVYIMANKRSVALYIGITSNLVSRIWQHKNDLAEGFSKKYKTHQLVYFELHSTMYAAITREKQLKKWNRAWRLKLIEALNPDWKDLYYDIVV